MKIAVTWGTEEGEICESVRHGFSVRAGGMKGSRENSLIWRGEGYGAGVLRLRRFFASEESAALRMTNEPGLGCRLSAFGSRPSALGKKQQATVSMQCALSK